MIVGAKGDGAGFLVACLAGTKTIAAHPAFLAVRYSRSAASTTAWP
jgi:hypothetical protein